MKFSRLLLSVASLLPLLIFAQDAAAQSMQVWATFDPLVQGSNSDQKLSVSGGYIYFSTRSGGPGPYGGLCRASGPGSVEVIAGHQVNLGGSVFTSAPIEVGGHVYYLADLGNGGSLWSAPVNGGGVATALLNNFGGNPTLTGDQPRTDLVEMGGALYFGNWFGGAFGGGTICRYVIATGLLEKVADLNYATTGTEPLALAVAAGELYVATSAGALPTVGALLKFVPGVGLVPIVWFGAGVGACPKRLRPDGTDLEFISNVGSIGPSCAQPKRWSLSTITQALTLVQELGCAVGSAIDGPLFVPEGAIVVSSAGGFGELWKLANATAPTFVSGLPPSALLSPFVEFGGGIVRITTTDQLQFFSMAPVLGASVPLGTGCSGAVLASTPPVFGGLAQISVSTPSPSVPGWLVLSDPPGQSFPTGLGCPIYVDPTNWVIVAPFATNAQGTWALTVGCPAPYLPWSGKVLVLQAVLFGGGGVDLTNGVQVTLGY